MKSLFLIRHCQAVGEDPSAPLTAEGHRQANMLATYMSELYIDILLSSPSIRAIHSIKPTAAQLRKSIVIDERMEERLLSACQLPDGRRQLEQLFAVVENRFNDERPAGTVAASGLSVISNALNTQADNVAVMTSSHVVDSLLNHFGIADHDQWGEADHPDVYVVRFKANQLSVERVWSCGQSLELLHT